jgi:hypothetical protein
MWKNTLLTVTAIASVVAAFFAFRARNLVPEIHDRAIPGIDTVAMLEKQIIENILNSRIGTSPIMASGGSMTFRLTDMGNKWNCVGNNTQCVTANKVPMADFAFYDVLDGAGMLPKDLKGLSKSWTLTMWSRNDDGTTADNGRQKRGKVTICTSIDQKACDPANTSYGGGKAYVLIKAEGGSGTVSLVDSNAADPASITKAKQFSDSGCKIHENDGKPIPACEHPGIIEFSEFSGGTFTCQHGNCQIGIGK